MSTTQQVALDPDELDLLVRHLKLAAGARLLVVVCAPDQVEPMLEAVSRQLTAVGKVRPVLRLDPYQTPGGQLPAVDEETLLRAVFEPLTTGEAVTQAGTLVVVDGSHGSQQDEHAWQVLLSRLNLARNTVMRRLGGPLLLALSPRIYSWLARGAPDLYSVRTAVVRLVRDLPLTLSPQPLHVRSIEGAEVPRASVGRWGRNPRAALLKLLEDTYDSIELMRLLQHHSYYRHLRYSLPTSNTPRREAIWEITDLLFRHGVVDRELFELLLSGRPKRWTEIAAVAELSGIDLFSSPEVTQEKIEFKSSPVGRTEAFLRPTDTPEAVLILASYNPEEVLPGKIHELRLYLPSEAEDRTDWERTTWTALRDLRQSLAAQGRRKLLILPRCVGGLAIRAGAVFHRASGLDVAVIQRDDEAGGEDTWILDGPASPAPLRTDERVPERAQTPKEIHLLLSITRDVFPQWSRWRFSHDQPAIMLHLQPSSGPGRTSVRGASAARDLALAITNLLLERRARHPDLPIRVFYAGPNGLAVAIGRGLNALGEIILMDLDKYRDTYVESFRFRAG